MLKTVEINATNNEFIFKKVKKKKQLKFCQIININTEISYFLSV